jgi:iron complex transport system substrate-binding protein
MVSAELILGADPDYILTGTNCAGSESPEVTKAELLVSLRADPAWSALTAVRNGRIIVIEADLLTRPGPRLIEALAELRLQTTAEQESDTAGERVAE